MLSYDLRSLCVEEYGEAFGELYDDVNRGIPIGNFSDTMEFIEMVEAVKEKQSTKRTFPDRMSDAIKHAFRR